MKKIKKISLIDWLNLGMFDGTILLSVGYTHADLCAYLKKIKAEGWLNAIKDTEITKENWYALRRVVENIKTGEKTNYLFIIIPRFEFLDNDFVLLAHEVLHIVAFYLPDLMDRNREYECEAYLHTHIMRQALNKIRGKKD